VRGGWGLPQCWLLCGRGGFLRILGVSGVGHDPTSSCHFALQGLAVGCSAAPVPHSDAAGQDALHGVSVGSSGAAETSWPVM
jgi:hypothetical protein